MYAQSHIIQSCKTTQVHKFRMDGAYRHVSDALFEVEDCKIKSVTEGTNKYM
jgi:hypothetical protein